MILDVGQLGGLIQVTAQYSNAVLVAMLPYVSDAAKKLDLPVPLPITQQQVVGSGVTPYFTWDGELAGWGLQIKGGWKLGFHGGHFGSFTSPHSYFVLQDPDEIPKFVGTVRMTKGEAVQMARETLKKLGILLESVYAEQEPRVTLPPKTLTGIVPRYRIEWTDPRADFQAVDIEVNADAKRVERLYIGYNPNLRRPWPKFGVEPVKRNRRPSANPEYAWKLLPIVLRAVEDYGKTLGLPIHGPLTTNQVARFEVGDNGGWPDSVLELTNGWRFIYRNSMVNGFYAPDNFFDSDHRPILIKEFVGKTNLTEDQAIALVKRIVAKLNYPTNLVHMDFKPRLVKPFVPGIPRCRIKWDYSPNEEWQALVESEVDLGKGEIKSLYFDNKAYWNHPPPIDVPISLPEPKQTNTLRSVSPQAPPKPPQRPFIPFDASKSQ